MRKDKNMRLHRIHRRLALPILCLSACIALSACQEDERAPVSSSASSAAQSAISTAATAQAETAAPSFANLVSYQAEDTDDTLDSGSLTAIVLSGSHAEITGNGAALHGSTLTISSAGTYVFSGTFSGSVLVDAPKDAVIRLGLNGVSIQSSDGPAIRVEQCDKTVILLPDGAENTLTDSAAYTLDTGSDEPDAAL